LHLHFNTKNDMPLRIVIYLVLFSVYSVTFAQPPVNDNCANAISLCPLQNVTSNNLNATSDAQLASNSCFTPSNGVWYKFKTIANGNASIVLSNINALNTNTAIQAAIISFTSGCDLPNANVLACNTSLTNNLVVNATGLTTNKTYYVYVEGGDALTLPEAEFNFNIKDSGTAVQPTAQIIKTDASCNQINGKILLKNIKLSNHPYLFSLNGATAQSDSSFLNLAGGNYSVIISDLAGCSFTIQANIINNTITNIQPNIVNADCATSQKGSITLAVTPANSSYSFSLDGGNAQASNTFNNVIAGTHFITISGIGCDTTFQTIVSLNGSITSALGQSNTINCGANNGSISYPNGVQPAAPAGTQYIFELVNTGIAPNISGVFNNLAPGTYKIKVYNSNLISCFYTDIITISQLSGPQIDATILQNETCGNGKGEIKVFAKFGIKPYQYSIDGTSFVSENVFENLFKGTYNVIVKDVNGCTSSKSVKIFESTPGTFDDCSAGETKTILAGDKVSVDVIAPPGATITWSPSSASAGLIENNFKLFPNRTTSYTMIATLPNGCICKSDIEIIVNLPIDVPNTFTPNGDGKNDKFLIKYTENYRNVEIDIFDRWGAKLYHNANYTDDTAWDGTSGGGKLPVATYYYIIKFKLPESSEDDNTYYYEGNLVLLK